MQWPRSRFSFSLREQRRCDPSHFPWRSGRASSLGPLPRRAGNPGHETRRNTCDRTRRLCAKREQDEKDLAHGVCTGVGSLCDLRRRLRHTLAGRATRGRRRIRPRAVCALPPLPLERGFGRLRPRLRRSRGAGRIAGCRADRRRAVGRGRKQTDYVAHTRVLFDFFYPIGVDGKPVIPGDVLHVPAGLDYSSTSPQVQSIVGAILANPQAAVALASVDQVELPWTSFPELINTIVRVLGYNILGTNDLLARTGGTSPFENRSTAYTGLGAYDAVVNASVDRFAGSTQAFNYLKAYYQPTGNLKANVLTLHTTLDPDVPFTHEQALKDIVVKYTKDSTPNKLAQQHYNRYGHCNFTPAETVDAFVRLVNWVERGVKPVNGALAP